MDVHVPERWLTDSLEGGCWAGTGQCWEREGLPGTDKDNVTPKRRKASRIHFIECRSVFTGQRRQATAKLTPIWVSA